MSTYQSAFNDGAAFMALFIAAWIAVVAGMRWLLERWT